MNVSRFLLLRRASSSSMRHRWRCTHARMNKTNAYFFRSSIIIMFSAHRGALCRESTFNRSTVYALTSVSPKLPHCHRNEDALPSRRSTGGNALRDCIKKIDKSTDTRAGCRRFRDETRVFARHGRVLHKTAGCATTHARAQRSRRPIAVQ